MSINGVGGAGANQYDNKVNDHTNAAAANQMDEALQKAEGGGKKGHGVDGFKKNEYKPDADKIRAYKATSGNKMDAFQAMVQNLVTSQGKHYDKALQNALNSIDGLTKEEAIQNISEDGEWGVEATAQRLFDFAQALSGGDPEKAELLRKAVQDGFKDAERVWGGKLPDISQQTYDRTMELFDDWAAQATKSTAVEE